MSEKRSIIEEGAVTGFIGATSIVFWFGIVDALAGQLYRTPTVLGQALFRFFGPDAGESAAPYVAGTLLAIRAVPGRVGLTRGLDRLLD